MLATFLGSPLEPSSGGINLAANPQASEKPVQVDGLIASRFLREPIFRFWPLHDFGVFTVNGVGASFSLADGCDEVDSKRAFS